MVCGVALYGCTAVLVLLRIIHYGISAKEFEPPYWAKMGALAVAVITGTNVANIKSSQMIAVFWSFCLWLVPVQLVPSL